MIDILIYGINGKMGKALYEVALNTEDVNVACGVDRHTIGNFDCPVYKSLKEVCLHVDVIIDFSSPSSLDDILTYSKEYSCPLLLATTGYTEAQKNQIELHSKNVPVCLTSNTSQGINALKEILPSLKNLLPNFDSVITETHGGKKKDSPSGTALTLSALLNNCGILSARGGDLAGIHEINFLGNREAITIKHVAFGREVFAEGAIEICKKLIHSPAGIYDNF